MAYIGRDVDKISNVEVLDNITFDGSSSYTLQKGGSNFTPSSANTLLLSIDGVVQAGNFTVSGSTIDFGTAVAGTSTCDFVLHYGVGLITTPSDGTVTTAKLADSSVSLAKLTATGTKDATTFLRGDNTFAEAGGGIEEADQWRINANLTTASMSGYFTANWERVDTDGFGKIGTGLTESSGEFSFASTGVYYIHAFVCFQGKDSPYYNLVLKTTTDNSTYDLASENYCFTAADNNYQSTSLTFIFNVTNITTHKVKFGHRMQNVGGSLQGQTNANGN